MTEEKLFKIPEGPIDRYRVTLYQIRGLDSLVDPIAKVEFVYYVNASWLEVQPGETDRPGVPFVNHWGVFEDGRLVGRTNDGWTALLEAKQDWSNYFATYEAAKVELIDRGVNRIKRLRQELKKTQRIVRRLRTPPHFWSVSASTTAVHALHAFIPGRPSSVCTKKLVPPAVPLAPVGAQRCASCERRLKAQGVDP